MGAQREILKCVATLSNWLPSVPDGISAKPSASVFGASAAASGTAPLT